MTVKTLHTSKLKKLRAAGWKETSVKEFLQLSDEEAMLVELNWTSHHPTLSLTLSSNMSVENRIELALYESAE